MDKNKIYTKVDISATEWEMSEVIVVVINIS